MGMAREDVQLLMGMTGEVWRRPSAAWGGLSLAHWPPQWLALRLLHLSKGAAMSRRQPDASPVPRPAKRQSAAIDELRWPSTLLPESGIRHISEQEKSYPATCYINARGWANQASESPKTGVCL